MAISGVGATPEPQRNGSVKKTEANDDKNKSIFSKYDSNQDGRVDANEQRIALTNFVANLYKNMKKNMNMTAINLISKFSNNFKDIQTDGTKSNADEANVKIDNMLNKHGSKIVDLIANGNDRTSEFESHKDFIYSKDLKAGDYCISKKGYIYQRNSTGGLSIYGGDLTE